MGGDKHNHGDQDHYQDHQVGLGLLVGLHQVVNVNRHDLGAAGDVAGHHQGGPKITQDAGKGQSQTSQEAGFGQWQSNPPEDIKIRARSSIRALISPMLTPFKDKYSTEGDPETLNCKFDQAGRYGII